MRTAERLFVIVYRAAVGVIVGAAALVALLMVFGIRPYAVRTGSMEPAIRVGSLVFVNSRARLEELRVGDVITFRVGQMVVTHRVARVDETGVVTRGDANNTDDGGKVTAETLIGRKVFHLPWAGNLLLFLQTLYGKIAAAATLAFLLAAGALHDRLTKRKQTEQ